MTPPKPKTEKLKVLFLAPFCDGNDVGEAFNSWRWASEIARHVDLTVLALHRQHQQPLAEQLPHARVITWDEPAWLRRFERFNAIAKPGYIKFYFCVQHWIKRHLAAGNKLDVIHQMTPAALRYPSPGAGWELPLIHGPVQGSLETPPGFREECRESAAWYMKLRNLDKWRLKFDPWLRRSLQNTDLLLVGSAYMREQVAAAQPRAIRELVHLNIDKLVPHPERTLPERGKLRLLYVGRLVRTKGLPDALKALALLDDSQDVTLDVIGFGPDQLQYEQLSRDLGISGKVRFHGRQPRAVVEEFYGQADVLLFPSFREPAGGVVIEAMRHGVPVITTNVGGPGYYVNASCGFTLPAISPSQLAGDIADAICKISTDPALLEVLRQGAYERAQELGDISIKLQELLLDYSRLAQRGQLRHMETRDEPLVKITE